MVSEDQLEDVSDAWADHLTFAVQSRDVHNRCRTIAKYVWAKSSNERLRRADISFDYVKQSSIPPVPTGTTCDCFVQRQGLDVNMFGIQNEGSGIQTTMLSLEGAKHDSNAVVSQIHHYLTQIDSLYGKCIELHAHMDSCTGQNKNNIILGYFILRVMLGYHETVVLRYMTVGHTKFGPDRIFGSIRCRMKDAQALSLPEFTTNIVSQAAFCSQAYEFNHYTDIRDYKGGTSRLFQKLPGFKLKFYYSIKIEVSLDQNGSRDANVITSVLPDGTPEKSYYYTLKGENPPHLDCNEFFPRIPAKPIGISRREALRETIWGHIKSRFPE